MKLIRLASIGALSLYASTAAAQSLNVKAPAPLSPGANQGSVDSFVGPHFWMFMATPGHFKVVFSGGGTQEGFSVGGHAQAAMAFAPSSKTAHFTERQTPQGLVFEGSVLHPQEVVVEVVPANSPLVRQTTNYTLTLSGDLGGGQEAGPAGSYGSPGPSPGRRAPIVGVYMAKINDIGAVRFLPSGEIVASNGANGTWTLFDPDSQIYTLLIGGMRFTVTFVPARGLVDTGNHNLLFEAQR